MNETTMIRCDNQSAIALSKSDGYRARSKHIDVQYHRLREEISNGIIRIEYVNTDENIADALTKQVAGPKMKLCANGMGLGIEN